MSPSRAKSGSAGARPSNPSLAPADKLKREIRGKRRRFRYTPAGLSRRAQTVLERVQAKRG